MIDHRVRKVFHSVEQLYYSVNTSPVVLSDEEDEDEEVAIIPVYFAFISAMSDGLELQEWFEREKEVVDDILTSVGCDDIDMAFRDLFIDCKDEQKINNILGLKALIGDDFDDFVYYLFYNYEVTDADNIKYEVIKKFLTNDFLE